jgi:ribosomal protein S27AE
MAMEFTTSYLKDSVSIFRYYKGLAERAMAQLTDPQLLAVVDAESNSIAVIVKHMTGNMRSRFTDFLTSDGEKPERRRDLEFTDPVATRGALMASWEAGWACVFGALEPLGEADLARTVTIRGEAHSVMQAINRQMAHYSYHCGQIVFMAKHLNAGGWKPLTVGRGQSEEFNRRVRAGEASQR